MRPSPAFDPRQRYRADFDEACARGYVDPDQVARGVNPAWFHYLHCAEMCERPPEEWGLEHMAGGFFGPVRIALRSLEQLKTVTVGDQVINAEALHRLVSRRHARSGWWPEVVRFLGAMQIDVAWVQDRNEIELRPTRRPCRVCGDPFDHDGRAHSEAFPREEQLVEVALLMVGGPQENLRPRARMLLQQLTPRRRTPRQLAAQLATFMHHPRTANFLAAASRERDELEVYRRVYLGEWRDGPVFDDEPR